MRAARLSSYHSPLELSEVAKPEIRRHEDVLVRIGGAGVCLTDVHAIDDMMGGAGVSLPVTLGHENAGWVEEVGDGVSTLSVGDPVIVYPPYGCGLCLSCRRGDDMGCERGGFTGLSRDGGFADYLVTTERTLIKLKDGLEPADVAPHADAGLTAYHAVRRVAQLARPGTVSVVVGIGGVGHIGLQLLTALGHGTVVAVDVDERRRQLARSLGAEHVVEPGQLGEATRDLSGGKGADVVVDFVGSSSTHEEALSVLAHGGTYSVVGYGGTITTSSIALVANEQSLVGNLVGTWVDLYELLALHATGAVRLQTERHRLEEVNDVLERLREGDVVGRAVLVPG